MESVNGYAGGDALFPFLQTFSDPFRFGFPLVCTADFSAEIHGVDKGHLWFVFFCSGLYVGGVLLLGLWRP